MRISPVNASFGNIRRPSKPKTFVKVTDKFRRQVREELSRKDTGFVRLVMRIFHLREKQAGGSRLSLGAGYIELFTSSMGRNGSGLHP